MARRSLFDRTQLGRHGFLHLKFPRSSHQKYRGSGLRWGRTYDRLRFLPRTRCHAFRLLGLEKWHHSTPKLRRLVHIRHPLSPPAQQHQQTHKKPHGLYPLLHPRRIFHHTLRICASVLTKKLPFLREAFQALATRYIDTRFTADILFRHT